MKAVAYYRVSTSEQGRSGLGLEGPWRTGFQVVTMAITVRNVVHNAGLGLRPFGSGCP